MCFAKQAESCGVMLIRYPAGTRSELAKIALAAVERLGVALKDSFVVLEPGRLRINRRGLL